jgi:prepilin-type N-terminal cleavage/methylation domain-containing protein
VNKKKPRCIFSIKPSIRIFTLIELLIVVAIIAILLSLLLPGLHTARVKAIEAMCLSNLKQSATALLMYQTKNDNLLPPSKGSQVNPSDIWYPNKRENIVPLIEPYIGNFNVWKCPFISTVNIDDSSNTKSGYLRGTYQYWANLDGLTGKILDKNLARQSPANVVLSDMSYTWNGKWRVNHDRGEGKLHQFYPDNPSFKAYINGGIRNINQVYADGSARQSKKIKMIYIQGG